MHIHVLTRGLGADYGYLGSAPDTSWWQDFGQLTATEYPTLLVHSDETGWQVYATAIPTTRHDRVHTNIRLSLVLADRHDGETTDGLGSVSALIGSWVAGSSIGASEELAGLLDTELPATDVERLIDTAGPDNDAELAERVHRALNALAPAAANSSTLTTSWVGDVNNSTARAAFVDRARDLLTGTRQGWAVQVNLAGVEEIAEHFESTREPWVALVDQRVPGGLREFGPKAKARPADIQSPTARTPIRAATVNRRAAGLALGAAMLGLVALIVWLLTNAERPNHPQVPNSPSPSTTRTEPAGVSTSISTGAQSTGSPTAETSPRRAVLTKLVQLLVDTLRSSSPTTGRFP